MTARTFLGARCPRSRSGTLTATFVPISTAGSLELERETIFWASCSWPDFAPSRSMLIQFFLTQRLQVTQSETLTVFTVTSTTSTSELVVISFNSHDMTFASWLIFTCHKALRMFKNSNNTKFRVVAVSLMPQCIVVFFLLNERFRSLSLTYIMEDEVTFCLGVCACCMLLRLCLYKLGCSYHPNFVKKLVF